MRIDPRVARAIVIGIGLAGAAGVVSRDALAEGRTHRIIYNDDAQGLYEAPVERTEQFLRDFLRREIAMAPITTFCFLAATPDVCTYQTQVGEVCGARFDEPKHWGRAIRALQQRGTDVLRIVISELRPRGLEILAAVRMNDTHHRSLDPKKPLCPQFAIDHPEYVIRQPDGRKNETALDYSYPEVREHRFAILRELATEYDLDGLELNFCRWAKHFPRHQGREKAHIMTEFIGRVRAMLDDVAKQRGRKRLTLGVRVPETIRACWMAGVDVRTWVRKGWVDYVVLATWNETDPQIDPAPFAEFTKPAGCDLLVIMGNMMGGTWRGKPTISGRGVAQFRDNYSGMLLSVPEARGCAANYYARGADGIAFWNISCNMGAKGKFSSAEQRERMRAWMNAVVDPRKVRAGPRRYHFLPLYKGVGKLRPPLRNYPWYGEGCSPLGVAKTQILTFPDERLGQRQTYRFFVADGRDGRPVKGTLGFRVFQLTADDLMIVDVNGEVLPKDKVKRTALDEKEVGLPGASFEIALEECPRLRGENELGLALQNEVGKRPVPYMEELDVLVH